MIQVYAVADEQLRPIPGKRLPREDDLQRWIAENPKILGLDLVILGREIPAKDRARIDVLGLDEDGNLVVIECKKDRTPREVIAQLLDYGSWAADLNTRQIHDLALARLKRPLADVFRERFERAIPEVLNTSHSLIVVATEFDPASRRIVSYLAEKHSLSINAIFFSAFEHQGENLLAIEWLLDQEEVTERAESKISAPWSGYYYVNVGESKDRSWEDMRRFGFISAGGGNKYTRALAHLSPGDFILAYQKQAGYVGFGKVRESAVPVDQFHVNARPIVEMHLTALDFAHNQGDLTLCEFVVRVEWIKTYSVSEAKTFTGAFANQNVVCKLRDEETIRQLGQYFPLNEAGSAGGE